MVFVDANEADSLLPKPPEYGDANSILNGGPQNAAPPPPSPITPSFVDTSYQQPDYSSPPSFSPPVASQDAYGLNYGPANSTDANNDGLNDQTGWANGVVQDYSSPSGFSYNGIPVTSDGAQYNPGPQQPQSEAGYNLNFASPFGGTANDAPVAPYTGDYIYQNPDTGGVTFSPDFQQYNHDTGNFQPTDQYPFDPNRSYAPGTAYDAMANHPNGGPSFLDTLKGLPGNVIDWGQRVNARAADTQGSNFVQDFGNAASGNHLINVLSGKDPNELPGPLPYVTDVAASPMSLIPGPEGIGPLSNYGRNILAGLAGSGASYGANEVLPQDMNPYLRTALVGGAGLLGGIGGYYAPEAAAKGASGISRLAESYKGTPLASEEGSVSLGSRLHLSTPDTPEPGARPGTLLQPKGVEQLPENYTPKDVLGVAGDLNRQVNSQANTLRAEAENALNAMGDRYKSSDGNIYFKDIPASPAEAALGKPNALAVRVLERPNEYNLTPEQRAAADKLVAIPEAVKNERAVFGVKPNEIALDEGQNYFHRTAVSPAIERPGQEAEISALANGGSTKGVKDLLAYRESSGGSSRLAIGKDKGRIIADPIDFVKRGGVYADPLQSLDQNVAQGLSKAANAHIKSLLEPFTQTAADRVSPGLRAKVDGLRQSINSIKQTGARLTDKQQSVIDNFLADKTGVTDLNELRDTLDSIRVGANAVGKQGPNFGKDLAGLRQTLADTKQQLRDILPDWRKEIQQSRSIPNDRAAVDSRLAPALIGSDFERNTAKQIERFYGRTSTSDVTQLGRAAVATRTLNTALIPVKATMDLSALLNQQGRLLVMHPKAYVTNFARSLWDVVNPTEYNKLLSSASTKEAASRGLSILGEAGSKNEFQFNNWFEHIPGVGKVAQAANRQFTTFNNRMRLTAFDDWRQAASAAGKPLDAAGEEQLATALNRMTGISKTRAGDLEQLAFFAPNFLRSHFENIGKAFTDGGIEGQVARRYLGTTFAVGTTAVAGAAMAQGRDPSEVLSPFDLKALKNGELRWNSNFGTIRVGGQDVQVYGPYTSLARLAAVATSGALDSVKQQDARPLLAALMDIPSTKGSPVARFITDAVKGQTYGGNSPTDFSPGGIANGLADMALPISIANVIQDKKQGMSWHDTILDSVLNAIGANSNPLTDYEKRDQQAQDTYGKPWNDLSPVEQNALKAQQGSPAATYQSTNPDAIASAKATETIKADAAQAQTGIDTKYAAPGSTTPKTPQDGIDWRDEYHTNQYATLREYRLKDQLMPYGGAQSTNEMRQAVDQYFATVDANKSGTKVNWDAVDSWLAAHPDIKAQVDAYQNDPNKPNTDYSPMVTQYKAASKALGDAGYFDVKDNVWKELAKNDPDLSKFPTYYDWKASIKDQVRSSIDPSAPQSVVDGIVEKVVNKIPVTTIYSKVSNTAEKAWLADHPKLAALAYQWGYLGANPSKLERAIAASGSGQ